MNIVAGLVIGIVVIGGALYAIGAIFAGALGFANSVWSAFSDLIGRKSLGARASIPEELREGSQPLPKYDPDRAELSSYDPRPVLVPIPNSVRFSAASSSIFKDRPEPTSEIDIERVGDILSMTSFQPHEPAFAILGEESIYPEPSPVRPSEIAPPPSWTAWSPSLGDPEFSPPLWNGFMSFLNSFVMGLIRGNSPRCERRSRTRTN